MLFGILLSTLAHAFPVELSGHAQDSIEVSVQRCEPDEYGVLETDFSVDGVLTARALCKPKICVYGTTVRSPIFDKTWKIQLIPGRTVLRRNVPPAEKDAALLDLVRRKVCKHVLYKGPDPSYM